ncbi:MAG TPA: hypothetical protein VM715_19770 [Candidatus Acidoferrum sp.]|nr:hypothetical protein [Candidatus Acidoferrum sp.]
MSAAPRFHLKQASGWFAAGREFASAATLLSDPAFKLFVWLCLHADRSQGSIKIDVFHLARALGKTAAEIRHGLDELIQKGICELSATGSIEILDRFWPYERCCPAERVLPEYINQVRRLFLARTCVRSTFTAADQKLAGQLHRNRVSIADVEHAILLGTLRKYVALLNHGTGTPITSLHYFTTLFDEVRQQISPGYWTYVAQKVRALEDRIARSTSTGTGETK